MILFEAAEKKASEKRDKEREEEEKERRGRTFVGTRQSYFVWAPPQSV